MADFFTILENTQVTADDILEAEAFTRQVLSAKYPDTDFREGTAVADLVIRPSATMVALINKGLTVYFESNTIADVNDDTPEEVVDKIMSNLFLERNNGTRAKVSARLFFSRRKSVTVPEGATFSTDDVIRFSPDKTYTFSSDQLKYDSNAAEYYVDIFLESNGEGTEYNIDSGNLLFFTNFDAYFLRGEISYLKESSSPKETNSEFIERSPSAISTRNLVNNPSIASRLQQEFPSISKLISVGHGDSGMQRDLVTMTTPSGATSTIHLGGLTDIYCSVPIVKDIEQFVTDSSGKVTLIGPYMKVTTTSSQGGSLPNDIGPLTPYTITIDGYNSAGVIQDYSKENGFSAKQKMIINFGSFYANKVVSFDTWSLNLISSIQTYLEDRENRLTCGSLLARGMPTYLLDIAVKSYEQILPTSEVVKPLIESYLRNLQPGEPFIMADLITELYKDSSVRSLQTPVGVAYQLFKTNGKTSTGTITDSLYPAENFERFELNTLTISSAV